MESEIYQYRSRSLENASTTSGKWDFQMGQKLELKGAGFQEGIAKAFMNRVKVVSEQVQNETQIQKSSLAWNIGQPHMVWKEVTTETSTASASTNYDGRCPLFNISVAHSPCLFTISVAHSPRLFTISVAHSPCGRRRRLGDPVPSGVVFDSNTMLYSTGLEAQMREYTHHGFPRHFIGRPSPDALDTCESNLRIANLQIANLRIANLRIANLRIANLRIANLRIAHRGTMLPLVVRAMGG
jgi:hypothetical protein